MIKKILFLSLLFIPFFANAQYNILVWQDEFEYNGLPDSTKWSYDVGGSGWGNQELQYYTEKRLENARVENGNLIIEARKEIYNGKNYTSARLVSRNKGDWTYGRIEVKARLPEGTGTWPAIWMLPTDWIYGDGSWPDNGEIDIMEHVGYNEGVIHGTIHTHDYNHADGTQQSGQKTVPDATTAFHVYAIEWSEDKIEWYIDDQKYFTYENNGAGWTAWPFDHPFHLIMNIAIGGTWGGAEGVDNTIFPQKLEIDYVRVYKTNQQLGNLIEGPGQLVPNAANVKYSSTLLNGKNYSWQIPNDAEIVSQDTNGNVWVNWGCQEGNMIVSTELNNDTYTDTLNISQKDVRIQGDLFWNETGTPLGFFVDSMHTTSYQWIVPESSTIISGQSTNSINVDWGEDNGQVALNLENTCFEKGYSHKVFDPSGQYSYPDPSQPHSIPGTINATNYDYGSEGVAYHDLESANQGDGPRQENGVDTEYKEPEGNIGWIEEGEWLEYTVRVTDTNWISAEFRTASLGGGGPLQISMNGEVRLSNINIPDTDDWGNFITLQTEIFQVTPQDTILRIDAIGGGFNLGNMKFVESQATDVDDVSDSREILLYPNPAGKYIVIQGNKFIQFIEIWNIYGSKVISKNIPSGTNRSVVDISNLSTGVYVVRIKTSDDMFVTKRFLKR